MARDLHPYHYNKRSPILTKRFLEDSCTNEEIINMLTKNVSYTKRRIIYEISSHQNRTGDKPEDLIKFVTLNIKYIEDLSLLEEEKNQNEEVPQQ